MAEESLKVNLISHSNTGLCNFWIIGHAAFAICFVSTSCASVLRIRFIFKLYATFSGMLASLVWLGSFVI